jgi:hypothetical protein
MFSDLGEIIHELSLASIKVKPQIDFYHIVQLDIKTASESCQSCAIFNTQLLAEPMGCWQVGGNPTFSRLVAMANHKTTQQVTANQTPIPTDGHNRQQRGI